MLENWSIKAWQWHSINFIPHFTIYSVCTSILEQPSKVIGRAFQLTIFGYVIDFMWPSSTSKLIRSCKAYGPLWSRRRKQWYWAKYYD